MNALTSPTHAPLKSRPNLRPKPVTATNSTEGTDEGTAENRIWRRPRSPTSRSYGCQWSNIKNIIADTFNSKKTKVTPIDYYNSVREENPAVNKRIWKQAQRKGRIKDTNSTVEKKAATGRRIWGFLSLHDSRVRLENVKEGKPSNSSRKSLRLVKLWKSGARSACVFEGASVVARWDPVDLKEPSSGVKKPTPTRSWWTLRLVLLEYPLSSLLLSSIWLIGSFMGDSSDYKNRSSNYVFPISNTDLEPSSLSHLLLHLNPSLWYSRPPLRMEKEKPNYKKVLCNPIPSSGKKETKVDPSMNKYDKGKTQKLQAVDEGSSNKKTARDKKKKQDKGKGKLMMDENELRKFREELGGVKKENVEKLKEISLFGFVIGDYFDMDTLKNKLDRDCWWFAGGRYSIIPKSDGWFEFRFNNPIDKLRVWESRPFHLFGNLLLLKLWTPAFDPKSESTTRVDMWIRILQLPPELISTSSIKTIVEKNKLGTFIRVDDFTEKGVNVKFLRICINMDVNDIRTDKILIPNDDEGFKTYTVWFEEFPKGCGNCGKTYHLFKDCPLMHYTFKPIKITLPKGLNPRNNSGKPRPAENDPFKEGWKKFSKKPSRFGTKGDSKTADHSEKPVFQVSFNPTSSNSESKDSNPSSKSGEGGKKSAEEQKFISTAGKPKEKTENENLDPSKMNQDKTPNQDSLAPEQIAPKLPGPMNEDKEEKAEKRGKQEAADEDE